VVEGAVALFAAAASGSVALLAFGSDSCIECASAGILIWRLGAERRGLDPHAVEQLDRRAHRMVGVTLYALAVYVLADAAWSLFRQERPRPSLVGIVVTVVSAGVMMGLARAKRRAARALDSRALAADSFQTTACWWLSIVSLGGVGLNALFGWWWADPVAALGMVVLLGREARGAWKGDDCCD
jgi:divalent metal cation (Fe/Co/Zn/Cd) transporter